MLIGDKKGKPEYIKSSNLLFYGLIIYLFIFYSQIGGRIPFLGKLRIEFFWGLAFLSIIIANLLTNQLKIYSNRLNSLIIIYFLSLLVGIPFAYVKSDSLNVFIQILKFFAIYIMIVTIVDDEKKLRIFIWAYVLMISLIFVEPFTWAIRGEGLQYNSGAMRLFGQGLWAHPNSLGGITVSNLPFFYFLFLYEKGIKRLVLACLICIAIGTIMFTSSRTAFVGVLAFALILWLNSSKKFFAIVIISISLMVIWAVSPQETKERFLTLSEVSETLTAEEGSGSAMDKRWQLIKNAVSVFKDHPVFGVGIGNYISVSGREYGIWLPTHNLYVQLIAEIGLVGTVAFGLLIYQIVRNLRDVACTIKKKGLESSLEYCVVKGVLYFLLLRLVLGLFGDDLIENYWWIAGGLSVALLRIVEEKPDIDSG